MTKIIFTTGMVICLLTGVFCSHALFWEQQDKVIKSGKRIGEEKDITECDPSSITKFTYLMTFHGCAGDECNDPMNHMIYIAGSDDGVTWSRIEEFEPISGSVPDIIFYNNSLYIFHTSSTSMSHWHKLNECFEVVDMGSIMIKGSDGISGFVDPCMIVDGDDLILVYLPGVQPGNNLAGCDEFPCTKEIHSAVSDYGDVRSFTQHEGSRASMYIESEESEIQLFCDPDILKLNDGSLLLYVSIGGGTVVYQGTSLTSTFVSPDDPNPRIISNVGGVPGSIQAPDGSVWLYVTKNNPEGGTRIARGVSSDGITPIADDDFSIVVDHTISQDFPEEGNFVSSPSVITWPEWSDESTTTTTEITSSTTSTSSISTTTTITDQQTCPAEKIYGAYSEETELLRYLRDNVLCATPEGQEIIRLYYEWSAVIVKGMEENEEFKEEVKELIEGILPMIR